MVAYCDTQSEHPDNERFLTECEAWFGLPIVRLRSEKYRDVDHVIEKERYLNGVKGARCTKELKIALRLAFQREGDVQVFGFDSGEIDRAFDFRETFPGVNLSTPLIKRRLTKGDCLALLRDAGIETPLMYRLGYRNNNCLGCVKGGMGYWNKIRVDFPEVFAKRMAQENALGATCIKGVFLRDLEPGRGRYSEEPDIACTGVCVQAREEIESC